MRKLAIPIFEGEDAFGWTSRVERYFELKGVSNQEKIQEAMVAMEGKALSWYQWWEFCAKNPTWDDFKTALIQRFEPTMLQSPYELLLSLKQTGLWRNTVHNLSCMRDHSEQLNLNISKGFSSMT